MGYGFGQGMMGPGMMGPGMMGRGMDPRTGPPARQALSTDDVKRIMEQRLAWGGNPNIRLGTVEEKGDDTIVAEIVTLDGSLVQRLEVHRLTGWTRPSH